MGEKDIQALFGIIALYPTIPILKALQGVRKTLRSDTSLSGRTDWNTADVQLLKICLEAHFKTIDGRILKRIDGTPTGKLIPGPLAGIVTIWLEGNMFLMKAMNFKHI